MCDHCGCANQQSIGELMDEHDQIKDLAWQVVESSGTNNGAADQVRDEFRRLLQIHSVKEELALYPLLVESGDLEEVVRVEFEREHRLLMERLDGGVFDAATVNMLAAHIEAEELDLFPFTMYVFEDDQWERMERVSHDLDHQFGIGHNHSH